MIHYWKFLLCTVQKISQQKGSRYAALLCIGVLLLCVFLLIFSFFQSCIFLLAFFLLYTVYFALYFLPLNSFAVPFLFPFLSDVCFFSIISLSFLASSCLPVHPNSTPSSTDMCWDEQVRAVAEQVYRPLTYAQVLRLHLTPLTRALGVWGRQVRLGEEGERRVQERKEEKREGEVRRGDERKGEESSGEKGERRRGEERRGKVMRGEERRRKERWGEERRERRDSDIRLESILVNLSSSSYGFSH